MLSIIAQLWSHRVLKQEITAVHSLTQDSLVRRDIDAFHDEADVAQGRIGQHGQHGLRTAISRKPRRGKSTLISFFLSLLSLHARCCSMLQGAKTSVRRQHFYRLADSNFAATCLD